MSSNSGYIDVTILSGQSLSPVVLTWGSECIVGIETPDDVDSATAMTFKGSALPSDVAANLKNVYDDAGNEVSLALGTDRMIMWTTTNQKEVAKIRSLQLRLGTAGTPVVATADRVFRLLLG